MKLFSKAALIAAATLVTFNASAAPRTDANYLAECKASVRAQFDDVQRIDVASMSSRRNLFKAKMRVKADGIRTLVACEIRGDQPVALNCLKGATCKGADLASS